MTCRGLKHVPLLILCVTGIGVSPIHAQDRDRMQRMEDPVVAKINEYIRKGWADNEVKPSDQASDEEWLRRVYLDLVGHIPPVERVDEFLADEDPAKRSRLVETLLSDGGYVQHWATVWTNNCIGRGTPRRVSRTAMSRFFREVFARNRPWNEVVVDLITAEGHFEKNGAVNYILAQLQNNDDQVQLTAKTARLFFGVQVQCTQCHNHPFNDWKQNQFWQLNAFFQRTAKVDHRRFDPNTGRQVDDYSEVIQRANFREDDYYKAKVKFEKRNGQMEFVEPEFFGRKAKLAEYIGDTNLRQELAKFVTTGSEEGSDTPLIARAMVNRVWGRLFGYGFTRPVDDMGPHNPPSHPELFEYLATQFVENGYDVKKLIGWIAKSEAYGLTSQFGSNNQIDDPAAGETPLFSHMYVKSMEAEQLYNSLIVATNAHKSGRVDYEEAERRRNRWMQQFVTTFGTDENDEATTFNGTIPQALMMMNGELVQDAISCEPGSFLHGLLTGPGNDASKINRLYLAALTRKPTRAELQTAAKLMRSYPRDKQAAAWQDLFWALLNSNEFVFIH